MSSFCRWDRKSSIKKEGLIYARIAQVFLLCPQQSRAKCLAGLFRCNPWPICPSQKEPLHLTNPPFVRLLLLFRKLRKNNVRHLSADCCPHKPMPFSLFGTFVPTRNYSPFRLKSALVSCDLQVGALPL